MNMDQLGQDSGRAAEYITLLKGVSPLAWTSFVIALAVGLYGMRLRNLLRSWVQLVVTVINMLLYSAITSVMAVSAVMLLPYVISDPSRELELGVLIMVSLFGIQAFVILAQRVFGPSADRFLDATFLGTVRNNAGSMRTCARFITSMRNGQKTEGMRRDCGKITRRQAPGRLSAPCRGAGDKRAGFFSGRIDGAKSGSPPPPAQVSKERKRKEQC